jgi:hypothetical protein
MYVLRALADGGRGGRFVGDEAAGFVGAVAEGALGGLAAAAESDCGLVGGDFEFGAAGIDEFKWAIDYEGAVRAHADGDVGHRCSLQRGCSIAGGRYFGRLSGGGLAEGEDVNTKSTFMVLVLLSGFASALPTGLRCDMG